MQTTLFHIFRNTPFGREILLQSLYFCREINAEPILYLPEFVKFLIYFDHEVVQIDLDRSYLKFKDTARENAEAILKNNGFEPRFFVPKNYTASNLPDINSDFDYMTCPRSISDLSSKIGLGFIGSRVRSIVQHAKFPILIPGTVFKQWESVVVFFGGSKNSINALKAGYKTAMESGKPLDIVTFKNCELSIESYKGIIESEGLSHMIDTIRDWRFLRKDKMEEELMNINHDALLVLGAYGHGIVKDVFFGSTMEKIQSIMPNNLLIAGTKL